MNAPQVTIYSTRGCSYCVAAKRLMERHGVPFNDIDLSDDPEALRALKDRTDHRTVPQIFVGERFIGGYDELSALVRREGVAALRGE